MPEDRPLWLFDESTQVGVDYNDGSVASAYDKQHSNFRNLDEEARKIAKDLELSQASTILDIGCGTGELATRLARICKHVYAVDISNVMVDVLRAKISDQRLENVSPAVSGLLTYEHKGEPLDAVVANVTLHHLPDFWKQIALCRLYDFLKPRGKLFLADVVFGFDPRKHREAIDSWLTGMRRIAGQQIADETIVHVRDEFSTWEWVMSGMLERAGFHVVNNIQIMPNMRAYICLK
jgi:ubiquinone/menaquinone biosynthesis C-methylase UbiE